MVRAYFTYVPSGLTIGFVNLSSGSPDSFEWDFGQLTDGNPSTSDEENPTFTYEAPGFYSVTLKVTKDGTVPEDDTVVLSIGILASGVPLPATIIDSLYSRLPSALIPAIATLDVLIKKWQLFLRTLIDPNIDESNAYNELVWPALVNELILNLVQYDLVTDAISNMALAASNAAAGSSGSSSETTTTVGGGGIKRIQTGPAEVEYFDNAISTSEGVANLTKSFTSTGGLQSFQGTLGARICVLSSRLRIPLEICPELAHDPVIPQVSRRHHHHSSTHNPFHHFPSRG